MSIKGAVLSVCRCDVLAGQGDLRPGNAGVDVPVVTEHQEPRRSLVKAPTSQVPPAHVPSFTGAPLSGGPLSVGPLSAETFQPQPSAAPLHAGPAGAPQLKRRRSIGEQHTHQPECC